jgi:TonB-dependent SusC/RagA subfamily outer membrane receptor
MLCARRTCTASLLFAVLTTVAPSANGAQSSMSPPQLAERGPMFYNTVDSHIATVDVKKVALLQHPIALDLNDAPLSEAIDAVARAAKVDIIYRGADLPANQRVTLAATKITVAGALTTILLGAGIDVHISPQGTLSLTQREPPPPDLSHGRDRSSGAGVDSITGVVRDAKTSERIAGAVVSLTGTDLRALTDVNGRYVLSGISPGSYTLVARRLAYVPATQLVTVSDATRHVSLDLRLQESKAMLDQVVTTATGNRYAFQVGNTFGIIDADSVVNKTAVSSLSDVITARVPGVQVFDGNILVGTSPLINIRGQNSFSLTNQPLLYIDGVRVSNDESASDANTFAVSPGRFNDIIPEEIESIQVVKGPAASALYGTDAANGVILVTTKQGVRGEPRWSFFGEGGSLGVDKSRFTPTYYPWGTATPGGQVTQCTLLSVAAGACVQDSITTFNPLLVPSLTPLGDGDLWNFGGQVSGGSASTRYFLSGTYSSQTGYLKLDDWDKDYLEHALAEQSLSSAILHPNAAVKYGGRLNMTSDLSPSSDVAVSASYIQQENRSPNGLNTLLNAQTDAGYYNPTDPYFGGSPGMTFINQNNYSTSHFVMSAAPTWRPASWLRAQGTVGVDHSQMDNTSFTPGNVYPGLNSYVADIKTTTTSYTLDGSLTASRDVGLLGTRTSVGGEYYRSDILVTGATGNTLAQGSQSLAGAASYAVNNSTNTSIIYGAFAEEQLSLRQSLFLTGGLRADGSSSFGQDVTAALYPRVNGSWSVANESFWPRQSWLSGLRLRAAYGEAGVQPPPTAKVSQESYTTGVVDGQPTQGIILSAIGNPNIKPERQAEFETGVDLDAIRNRAHVEFTYYDKHSSDAIVQTPGPTSIGGYSIAENVGSVRNWGYEGLVSVTVLDSRLLRWELTANGSTNHNQLVRLGDGISNTFGSYGGTSLVQGYPIYSYFGDPISYNRSGVSNGILQPNAVTVGANPAYRGPSFPGIQETYGTTLSLFGSILQLRVQFDHRGDVYLFDGVTTDRTYYGTSQETSVPGAPLKYQAAAIGLLNGNTDWGYFENAAFTRLRELSLSFNAPVGVARAIRANALSVTLSGRNLAVWTAYRGADPEVGIGNGTAAGAYHDVGTPIPTKYWLVRVSLGY